MKKIILSSCLLLASFISLKAQVKIGDNPNTINPNSLFELESTNKGFVPPRVALNNVNATTPLAAGTASGTIVYSIGGTLTDGLYVWNGVKWLSSIISDQPHGVVSSSISQFVSSTTAAAVLTFENNDILNSISHSTVTNTSHIIVQNPGTYFIQFSAQLYGGGAHIDIWLRKNGVDVPMSNTRSSLQNSSDYRTVKETFMVTASANDYFELVQSSTNTSAGLTAISAGTSPTRPAGHSIKLEICKIAD